MTIWILVADNSGAKIISAENSKAPLVEIEDFVHTEGRMHEGDLVADSPGSDGGGGGQGLHVLDGRSSAKQQQGLHFAKSLAERLDKAQIDGNYNRLMIVAPPTFLGVLRNQLSKEVTRMVIKQIDKNLVRQPLDSLRQYL